MIHSHSAAGRAITWVRYIAHSSLSFESSVEYIRYIKVHRRSGRVLGSNCAFTTTGLKGNVWIFGRTVQLLQSSTGSQLFTIEQ